jgi:hypothetical protein
MPDGVPVIEHRPQLRFLLVALDHVGFEPTRAGDHAREGIDVAGEQGRAARLEVGEIGRVQDDAVLDDLSEPRAKLAIRKRRQHGGIHQHQARLMEGADQVLGPGMIHRGLAPDRGVHLAQQRGRHLHEVDAAHVGSGDEAREVAHRAAAQRDHGGARSSPASSSASQPRTATSTVFALSPSGSSTTVT